MPLCTRWRYLRCELSFRIQRFQGDLFKGGLIDHSGDLDNACKTLVDALRMPSSPTELPPNPSGKRPVFFCVMEDDRLVSKITLETRDRLGPRPRGRNNDTKMWVDIDVKIYPIYNLGTVNYPMLFP